MASYLDGDMTEGLKSKENPFFISTYLDSPILCTITEKFREGVEYWNELGMWPPNETQKSHLKKAPLAAKEAFNIGLMLTSPELPPDLCPEEYPLLSHMLPAGFGKLPEFEKALSLGGEIYHDACSGLEDWMKSNAPAEIKDMPFKTGFPVDPCKEESYWYSRWGFWDTLTETVAAGFEKKKQFSYKVDFKKAGSCITNGKIVVLHLKSSSTGDFVRIMSWDQIMMIKDLCFSRAQVYTSARVLYPESPKLVTAISETISWHEECLLRYKNKGFEILKHTESLSKAYLSLCSGDKFGAAGPYGRMIAKVEKKERDLGLREGQESMASKFTPILDKIRTPALVTEIFGLQKISGHPIVDPREGGRTVKEISCAPSTAGYTDSQRLRWNFCRIVLESYVPRMGWPPLHFTDKTTELYRLHSLQRRHLDRYSYPLTDWASCTFGRIFEFDFSPNYLDLMDDKAISQYRSNIASNWDKTIPAISNRRLLLELLSRKDVDPRDIIRRVMRREVPLEWLIVCLYPKEREFKISPRMFAMMVFEMRLAWTLLETNLADNVFKYIPQQTMTKDRLETLKLLLDISKPNYSEETLHMFLEMDLSTWCQKWRAAQVNPVAEVIEDMFDMPGAYTYIHEFFSSSMMVIRTGDLRPEGIDLPHPPESDLVYYNDLGGKEGIQQKLWTACTVSMIDLGLFQFPVSYRLIGQADNQVASVNAPYDKSAPIQPQLIDWRDKLLQSIDKSCRAVNQDLKPNECLESTTVITYSKDVYVNGVVYPTSLKFHSRLFPHSSQDFPSVRSNVGAVFSTALAGAERSSIPVRSYYLALLQASMYLFRKSKGLGVYGDWMKRQLRNLSPAQKRDALYLMLVLPSDLGGFPVPTIMSFVYKGGADPLAKSLSGLMLLRRRAKSRICDRLLSQLSLDSTFAKEPNLLSLLKDPYSLPLLTPSTAIDQATESTVAAMLPRVLNDDIYQILDVPTDQYIDQLVSVLGSVRPFNPLILRDILECSVYGISSTIKKMFVATRTIQTVSRLVDDSIVPGVLSAERDTIEYVLRRYSSLPKSPWRPMGVYEMCISLRKRWTVSGLPFPEGVTSYSPLDFRLIFGSEALSTTGLHAVLIGDPRKAFSERGPFDPYLGSKTKEKRSEHGYKIVDSDTTSESFRKLQRILAQTRGNQHFQTLIDCVGLSRSTTILSSITDSLEGEAGGTFYHRYDSISGHQDAYSHGCPTFYTHCLISSDHSGKLSGGAYDYNIMLQPHFLTLLWSLSYYTSLGLRDDLIVAIDTESVPLVPLPAIQMELDSNVHIPITTFRGNKLAYLDQIRVDRTGVALRQVPQLDAKFRGLEFKLERERDRRAVLEGWFTQKIRSQSGGRQAADGKHLGGFGVSMDIAEVVSNGLTAIVVSMSNTLADHYLLNNLRTVDSKRERWNAVTFISLVADPLVRTVSAHLGHPSVRQDPLVKRFQLYDSPSFRPNNLRGHDRLRGIIVGESLKRVVFSSAAYAERVSSSFSVSVGYVDIEALLACLARVLNHLVLTRGISPRDRRYMVKTFILQVLRLPIESPSKLVALDMSLVAVCKWLDAKRKYSASALIKRVQKGELVRYYRIDPSEALRHTRSLNPDPATYMPALRRRHPKMSPQILRCCYSVKPPPTEMGTSRLSPNQEYRTPAVFVQRTLVTRYLTNETKYPGCPSSTFSVMMELQSVFEGRSTLCVGVGEGYTSAAALLSGAREVIGLDLQRDIPLREHRFMDYAPPAVLVTRCESRFRLHQACLTTTGDWYDQTVSSKVCRTLPDDPVVVIDIESGSTGSLGDMLQPLQDAEVYGTVIIRAWMNEMSVTGGAELLMSSRMKFRIILIQQAGDLSLILILITECRWPMYQTRRKALVTPPELCLQGVDYPELKPREIRLSDAILNTIDVPHGISIVSIKKMLEWMVLESKADPLNRMTYDGWTTLLQGYISAYLLRQERRDRINMLKRWESNGEVDFSVGAIRMTFKLTHNLKLHLGSTVARAVET